MTTAELVKRCEEALQWKRTTTYTVLKKLSDRGLFRNDGGVVTARISREEYYAMQSQRFVEETFAGSLPAFIAAFARRKSITKEALQEIRAMLDAYEQGGEE